MKYNTDEEWEYLVELAKKRINPNFTKDFGLPFPYNRRQNAAEILIRMIDKEGIKISFEEFINLQVIDNNYKHRRTKCYGKNEPKFKLMELIKAVPKNEKIMWSSELQQETKSIFDELKKTTPDLLQTAITATTQEPKEYPVNAVETVGEKVAIEDKEYIEQYIYDTSKFEEYCIKTATKLHKYNYWEVRVIDVRTYELVEDDIQTLKLKRQKTERQLNYLTSDSSVLCRGYRLRRLIRKLDNINILIWKRIEELNLFPHIYKLELFCPLYGNIYVRIKGMVNE